VRVPCVHKQVHRAHGRRRLSVRPARVVAAGAAASVVQRVFHVEAHAHDIPRDVVAASNAWFCHKNTRTLKFCKATNGGPRACKAPTELLFGS
jgi:hypothetical protein